MTDENMKNQYIGFAIIALVAIAFASCKPTPTPDITVKISCPGADSTIHIKFRAMIMTGENSRTVDAEAPYSINFKNEAFIITALPENDNVNLEMEASAVKPNLGNVHGYGHIGTIYFLPPKGGPGYMGRR
jgi:hypothetical protein